MQQESDWDKYKTFMDDMRKNMEIIHVKFDFLINRVSYLENALAKTQCKCDSKETVCGSKS